MRNVHSMHTFDYFHETKLELIIFFFIFVANFKVFEIFAKEGVFEKWNNITLFTHFIVSYLLYIWQTKISYTRRNF